MSRINIILFPSWLYNTNYLCYHSTATRAAPCAWMSALWMIGEFEGKAQEAGFLKTDVYWWRKRFEMKRNIKQCNQRWWSKQRQHNCLLTTIASINNQTSENKTVSLHRGGGLVPYATRDWSRNLEERPVDLKWIVSIAWPLILPTATCSMRSARAHQPKACSNALANWVYL